MRVGFGLMRLLLTTDTVGGVWTYALELSRALAGRDVCIALATMGAPLSPDQWQEARAVPGLTIHESAYRLEWMDDPWDDLRRAGDWLQEIAAGFRPDVVHLNGYAHGALPWPAPVLMVGHSCVLSWWEAVRGGAVPNSWNQYREVVTEGLQAADMVAAPTRAMLGAMEHHYGPFRHGCVIANGRAATHFQPAVKEPFVLAAGRFWDEAKNLAALDGAAEALEWPVYVAGDCRHPDGGEMHPRYVRTLGRLTAADLGRRMGHAAIYALPARYEPFGLSALEAAYAGCALVLGDIPSLREVWGDAATYVPPDDTAALRRALQALIADPVQRRHLAQRARQRAHQFTPERMAHAYLDAYRSLLHAPDPADAEEETPACVS